MVQYRNAGSCANGFGRLAQCVGTIMSTGTNTIFFISHTKTSKGRQASYIKPVASIRPNKTEINRVRLTACGDNLEYPDVTSTDVASLTTTKIHLNSVVSTPTSKYITSDIKDFYYNTPLERFEYPRVPLTQVLNDIVAQYDLRTIADGGWVYIEVRKGVTGLKQAGKVEK